MNKGVAKGVNGVNRGGVNRGELPRVNPRPAASAATERIHQRINPIHTETHTHARARGARWGCAAIEEYLAVFLSIHL